MSEPAAWLVANLDAIPRGGSVLDVACGTGRNTAFLVSRGWRVHAVDRDAGALDALRRRVAAAVATPGDMSSLLTTDCLDLESGSATFGSSVYDAVIVFNYLHRPFLPTIIDALVPGGVLIYETFTTAQAARGRPRNPAFLLHPGELSALVAPLRILRAREGEYEGKFVASIVAMR
jgi:SAM-dependent methyltransferase